MGVVNGPDAVRSPTRPKTKVPPSVVIDGETDPGRSNDITWMPGRTVPGDDLLGDDPEPDARLIYRLVLVLVAGRVAQIATTDRPTPLQPLATIRRHIPKNLDRPGDQDTPQLIAILRDRDARTWVGAQKRHIFRPRPDRDDGAG